MTADNMTDSAPGQFKMNGRLMVISMIFVIFLAIGFMAVAWLVYRTGKSGTEKVWVPAGMAVLAALSLLYARHLYRISKSVIEITSAGISRKEADGLLTNIQWGEIGRILERGFMQQLAIADRPGSKKVLIDYQFDGYDVIRKRVFDEYEKRMTVTYPVVFGRPGIGGQYTAMILILAGIAAAVFFLGGKTDPAMEIVVMACITAPLLILFLVDMFRTIKQVEIDRGGFKLKKLTGGPEVLFSEITDIEYKYISANYRYSGSLEYYFIDKSGAGQKKPVIVITRNDGKKYTITTSAGPLPEIFICLKKTCGKAGVPDISAEVMGSIKASDLI